MVEMVDVTTLMRSEKNTSAEVTASPRCVIPPATIVSDAASVSRIVDGYLIVIRHNSSEFSKINETLRQMDFADAKILGFVYNGKDEQKKYYKNGKYSKYYYNNYYYKKSK